MKAKEIMARYRVGDSFLSEAEYKEHLKSESQTRYFFVGFLATFLIMIFLLPIWTPQFENIPKLFRFLIISISSLAVGFLLSAFSELLNALISILLIVFIMFLVGYFLWSKI